MNWEQLGILPHSDPWEKAIAANALYECPKGPGGKRLGPLVTYAGKAPDGSNLVGDVYFNFAMVEEHPDLVALFAGRIVRAFNQDLSFWHRITTVVGIPDGGRTLGQSVAELFMKRFVYPSKVPRPKSDKATKEEYDLVFKRMSLTAADRVVVCDDVHNNFQNTNIVLDAIHQTGATVLGLCSALNRSPFVDSEYVPDKGAYARKSLRVVSAVRKALPEYNQTDPLIAIDVSNGNVVSDVKNNWVRLRKAMADANGPAS